jgi:zinc transport system substrate-binding protein
MRKLLLILCACAAFVPSEAKKLRIGVSLLPYYSFTKNVVGDRADVVPLVEANSNVHGYRITPQDIKRALDLDVMVVNGVGHDEFAMDILKAAGVDKKIKVIYANKDVALIPQSINSTTVNSHTFVSISASIQQIYTIANSLSDIDPQDAAAFRANASAYAGRLRSMKAEYMARLAKVKNADFRCATIHGGYSYLLQEFGFQVDDVIEPAHGVEPSAAQLSETIRRIKNARVTVVFSEADFPSAFVATIRKETGVTVKALSHLSQGDYTADFFEKHMRSNLDTLLSAVEGSANALRK